MSYSSISFDDESEMDSIGNISLSPISKISKRSPKAIVRIIHDDESLFDRKPKRSEKSNEIRILKVQREKVLHLNGIRFFFRAALPNSEFISAKCKNSDSKYIYIRRGYEIHLSDTEFDMIIQSDQNNTQFTVFHRNINTLPVFVAYFDMPREEFDGYRKVRLQFLSYPSITQQLVSLPIMVSPGFGGMFRIPSVKNAVFAYENEEEPVLIVRKTEKNSLVVESKLVLDQIELFALAIIMFMGRKPV